MSYFIELPTFEDPRGVLTVIDRVLPYEIKRVYFIYKVTEKRGGHRHKKTIQGLICLNGSCEIFVNNGKEKKTIFLNDPKKCLILETVDWHTMDNFSEGSILLVFSSEPYDRSDYIDEVYPND